MLLHRISLSSTSLAHQALFSVLKNLQHKFEEHNFFSRHKTQRSIFIFPVVTQFSLSVRVPQRDRVVEPPPRKKQTRLNLSKVPEVPTFCHKSGKNATGSPVTVTR